MAASRAEPVLCTCRAGTRAEWSGCDTEVVVAIDWMPHLREGRDGLRVTTLKSLLPLSEGEKNPGWVKGRERTGMDHRMTLHLPFLDERFPTGQSVIAAMSAGHLETVVRHAHFRQPRIKCRGWG
jgi:hypothetical protein